jgi:hypothetical protein
MYSSEDRFEQILHVYQRASITLQGRPYGELPVHIRPLGTPSLWNMGSRLTRRHLALISKAQADDTQ